MKKNSWLIALLALLLAGTLTWADLSYAQPAQRGQGGGGRGQATCPAWGSGQGSGNATCPNYPGYQQRGRGAGRKGQAGNCPWVGTGQTPTTPQSQTPAPQSGK
jgi:hypothetical protein